jgi:hypothetical protein
VPRIRFEDLRGELSGAGFSSLDAKGDPTPITVERMVAEERDRHLVTVVLESVKAEVFFPFLPLQHSILRRAVKLRLGRQEMPITTAEDLVVLKMAFHREKDLRDVRGILWAQKGKLDLASIREWAGRMLRDESRDELEGWIRRYAG